MLLNTNKFCRSAHSIPEKEDTKSQKGINNARDFNTGCCCLQLHQLYLITGITHAVLFTCTLAAAVLFESNPSMRLPHIVTPVTQTIGVWVDSNQLHMNTNRSFGNDVTLDEKCQFAQANPSRLDGVSIMPVVLSYGWLNLQYMIPCFFFLSALFQCAYPLADLLSWIDDLNIPCLCSMMSTPVHPTIKQQPWDEMYYHALNQGKVHRTHFIEYSFSASLMILIICAQLGITDLVTLILAFAATWACMMFGLLAELFTETDVNLELDFSFLYISIPAEIVAHFCGWVVLIAATAGALTNLINSITCINGLKIPSFVIPIVAIEFTLFTSFGVVQILSIRNFLKIKRKDDPNRSLQQRIQTACTAEYRYILLSLVAKTTLAAGIFIGLYQVKKDGHP